MEVFSKVAWGPAGSPVFKATFVKPASTTDGDTMCGFKTARAGARGAYLHHTGRLSKSISAMGGNIKADAAARTPISN